jgi:hypothetical protein
MKNFLFLFLLLVTATNLAQSEFAIGVTVEDRSRELPEDLRDMLYNRVQRGLARHGVGANQAAMLSVLTTVDEGELSMTNTAPARYIRSYYFELQLSNKQSGEVFATYSEDVKVAKRSEQEAVRSAVASLALRGERFQEFVGKAKDKISSYYKSNCTAVLADAEQQLAVGNHLDALQTLFSIPTAATDCSQKVIVVITKTYADYEAIACARQTAYAEALAANEDFDTAVLQLLTIPDPSLCEDRFTAIVLRLQSIRQQLRNDAFDRLVLLSELEANREERQRRFLENMAFIYSTPSCREVDDRGRVTIID